MPIEAVMVREGGSPDAQLPDLPVLTLADAIPHLRRPFAVNAVKFKVQAAWNGGALIVAYIDARLVIDRLNLVCPADWSDAGGYSPLGAKHMVCALTVFGVTRQDVGQGEGKGLYSDAFKRAAVKFGIGVSLYAIPKIVLNDQDRHLKRERKGGRDQVTLTDAGEKRCREIYAAWLAGAGQVFGPALEHGDVEGAVGDVEGAPEPVAEEQVDLTEMEITEDYAKGVVDAVWKAGLSKQLQLAIQHVTGRPDIPEVKTKGQATKLIAETLNSGQVGSIERWVQKHQEEGK